MQVKHTGPERVLLVALGEWVEPGEPVDVPDDVGASLVEQGWKQHTKKAAPAVHEKED